MRRGLSLVIAGCVAALGVAVNAQLPAAPDAARVEAGRKVYEREKCATCHQIAGRGNSRFPLDGVGRKLTSEQLRLWITDTLKMEDALPRLPVVRMSATKYRLSAKDLDALVLYLGTLH
jgi:mono/diheme cytochrome c family protein